MGTDSLRQDHSPLPYVPLGNSAIHIASAETIVGVCYSDKC